MVARSVDSAQAPSARQYQRPTRRRPPPPRPESDVARDAMIDQIMRDAQVPIYDQRSTPLHADEGEENNDDAVAEAFKAQLIAEMELHKRRKPLPGSGGKAAAAASTGPKLGGSRMQREKMKALEEAKAGSSKK